MLSMLKMFKKKKGINKNGYWEGLEAASQHIHDAALAESIISFFLNDKDNKCS